MAVFNLGSINIDNFYRVPHLPGPGETLSATSYAQGLGGKGANMSVAIARAAARAIHIGAVGSDGTWCVERLLEYGVDTRHIAQFSDARTGHANICVAEDGENQIVIHGGTNQMIGDDMIQAALTEASQGDYFLMQNETNNQISAAEKAKGMGLRVVYAAAPFDPAAVQAALAFVDLLVLNEVEAAQLEEKLSKSVHQLGVHDVVVTLGAEGCRWLTGGTGETHIPAIPVTPVDTTGAGDTFTGYLVAGLDRGMPMKQALSLANCASALMVMRHGTADVIPDLKDVEDARFA